jgi:hypothetical protein
MVTIVQICVKKARKKKKYRSIEGIILDRRYPPLLIGESNITACKRELSYSKKLNISDVHTYYITKENLEKTLQTKLIVISVGTQFFHNYRHE